MVVDTEFIFALRKSDRLHKEIEEILTFNHPLAISSPSIFETILVLLSHGKTESQIITFIETIGEISLKHNIMFVNNDIEHIIEGLRLHRDHEKGGLFDSLIAGAAKKISGKILANDKAFEGIHGLTRITFKQFLESRREKNMEDVINGKD